MTNSLVWLLTNFPFWARWFAYVICVALYILPQFKTFYKRIGFKVFLWRAIWLLLAFAIAVGRIGYAVLLSATQFHLWAENEFAQLFLKLPASPKIQTLLHLLPGIEKSQLGYFFVYSWGRFWINPLLAILLAALFYFFLLALKRYNDRFFKDGETELGFAVSLLVGWPGFVIFLWMAFASVILISLIRTFCFREPYTTLSLPLLFAAGATLLWGDALLAVFNLDVLRI